MEETNSPLVPWSVTVRRNPHRKARPTPSATATPSVHPHANLKDIPSFPIDEILSIQTPQNPKTNTSSTPSNNNNDDNDNKKPQISESLKVYLRIRPLRSQLGFVKCDKLENKNVWPKSKIVKNEKKKKTKSESCIIVKDSNSVILTPPLVLQDSRRIKSEVFEGFSHVFSPDSTQVEVYEMMVNPLVEDFLGGKSGMLVALGPSGSGKTHTVFGSAREPGMIPLTLRHIFQPIDKHNPETSRPSFFISMFEICCEVGKGERILDLSPDGNELSMYQSTITGLQELIISDVAQAESVIACGMLKRATAMTNINHQSSRSQCVINIRYAPRKILGEVDVCSNNAVLTIIDLAGAEREKNTGIQGKRLGESNFINNTSMVLGLCLRSLLEHQKNSKKSLQKHFQSSLLTRYLRDYLEGKKRMTLILTVKSEEDDYSNTSFLLRQASPFAKIKFSGVGQQPDSLYNKRQMQIISRLEQPKRIKVSDPSAPEREKKGSGIEKQRSKKEKPKVIQDGSQLPKIDKINGDDNCHKYHKENERYHQITQSLAKAMWNVLKEYKFKLQVAENEVQSLRESLRIEQAKFVEEALKDLKVCCRCSEQYAKNKALLKFDASSESKVDRSSGLKGHVSNNSDESHVDKFRNRDLSNWIDDIKECESLIGEGIDVFLQPEGLDEYDPKTPSKEEDIEQLHAQVTTGALSSNLVTSECKDKEQKSGVSGQSLEMVNSLCISVEDFKQKNNECMMNQKYESCQEISVNVEDSKHSKYLEVEDNFPAADLTGQQSLEFAVNSSQPLVTTSNDSCSAVKLYPLRSEEDGKLNNGALDKRCNVDNLQKNEAKCSPCSECTSIEKPKRRLLPASSLLLRDMSFLGFKDENEKPKGNRSEIKLAIDQRKMTTGSTNLLRLLKSNLHL